MAVDHMRAKVITLVAFVLMCALMFVYLFQQAGGRVRLHSPYTVSALVPDSLNIVNNSDVRRDGVTIGRVRDIQPQGIDSKLTFEIEKKNQAQLYRDATVQVRTKTLVGESYLDVNPGTVASGKLPDHATLPLTQSVEVVPLERILSTLDAATRDQVRRNLKGIGVGLDQHGGDLNRLFGAVKPAVASGGNLMRVLAPQKQELAALVGNTGEVLQALGERTAAFRGLAIDAKATAEAVAQRDAKLQESLRELPATLDQAQSSVTKLASFSGRATPVVRSLKLSAQQLSPALRDLGPAARSTRTLFRELSPFLKQVDPLLGELTPAAAKLRTVVGPLDAVLRQLDPAAAYLKPYSQEVSSFFANVGSLVSGKDAYGYKGRAFAVIGPDEISNLSPEAAKVIHALTSTATLGLLQTRANPYPQPGSAGTPRAGDGSYTRVQAGG